MEILSLIPARSGSKGVLNKNLLLLDDYPLIAWSIKASLMTNAISRTIVSTDSEEYASIAKDYGAEVPFLRPREFALDSSKDIEFMKHALDYLEAEDYSPDYIVHLRPTSPLRFPEIIENAIAEIVSHEDYTALRSVHEMSESAYKTFEIDNEGFLNSVFYLDRNIENSNNARQSFPKTYFANGYVDIINVKHLKTMHQLHGNKVLAFLTQEVVELDSEHDLFLLEQMSKSSPLFKSRLFGE